MAKRKDSLALFEVFGKKPKASSVLPSWMQKQPPAAGDAPAAANDTAGAPTAPTGAEQPPGESMPPQLPPAEAAPTVGGTGSFERSGVHVRLTMSQTGWLVSAAGVLVLLAASFLLGRLSAPTTERPLPPILPAPGAGTPAGPTGGGEANRAKTVSRIVGKYYLVIQGIKDKDKDKGYRDAENIVAFLAREGVPADIRELGSSYIVWSGDPMDKPDDAKALDYVRKIEDLGKKYKSVGAYDFNQKGSRDGKPWYIKHTTPK